MSARHAFESRYLFSFSWNDCSYNVLASLFPFHFFLNEATDAYGTLTLKNLTSRTKFYDN